MRRHYSHTHDTETNLTFIGSAATVSSPCIMYFVQSIHIAAQIRASDIPFLPFRVKNGHVANDRFRTLPLFTQYVT